MSYSFKDYHEMFPLGCEGAGGAAGYGDGNEIPEASFDQCEVFESGRLQIKSVERWSNKGGIGNGTGHANRSIIDRIESGGSYSGALSLLKALWVFNITMGAFVKTTPGGATDARQYLFSEMAAAAGSQLPSSELVIRSLESVGYEKWLGIVGESFNIKGGVGSYVSMDYSLVGNGRKKAAVGVAPVAAADPIMLRNALGSAVNMGDPGSTADVRADIVEWEFSYQNELTKRYIPRDLTGLLDATDRESAQIIYEILAGTPSITGSLTLMAQDDTPLDRALKNKSTEFEIVCESDAAVIESGQPYSMTISGKQFKLLDPEQTEVDGQTAWKFSLEAEQPGVSLADMFSIAVVYTDVALGAYPA